MKKALTITPMIVLFMALGLSLARASQQGGLPALELRVQALEAKVAALISQFGSLTSEFATLKSVVSSLQKDVAMLKSAVSSLQKDVATLKSGVSILANSVLDLQGQNNWAVVDSSANVVRHNSALNVTAAKMGTGMYEVTFGNKNVTGCAYTATIGDVGKTPVAPGFITVSGGLANNLTDVQVRTFDKAGAPANSSFHLYVSCR
jgi:hypothetical protein